MDVRAKQLVSKVSQKRPFLIPTNQLTKNPQNLATTILKTYLKNKVSILVPSLAFKT